MVRAEHGVCNRTGDGPLFLVFRRQLQGQFGDLISSPGRNYDAERNDHLESFIDLHVEFDDVLLRQK